MWPSSVPAMYMRSSRWLKSKDMPLLLRLMKASPLTLRMAAAAAGLTFCLETVLFSLIKSVCSRPYRAGQCSMSIFRQNEMLPESQQSKSASTAKPQGYICKPKANMRTCNTVAT